MQLIWHILRKDARRCWRQAGLSSALLIWLANADASRTGAAPGAMEGWLHLLVPLAWGFLLAAVVQEDRPLGDRAAWMTLPLRWWQVISAKLLFAALFVHLPCLLAHAAILTARGFEPWLSVPQLFAKQLEILLVVTLPSLALAALCTGMTQFAACALPVVAAFAYVSTSRFPMPWQMADRFSAFLASLVIAAGSLAVLWWQYRRQAPRVGRIAGAAAAAVAGFVYLGLSPQTAAYLTAALSPEPSSVGPIKIRVAPASQKLPDGLVRGQRHAITVAVPVVAEGWPVADEVRLFPVQVELLEASGRRHVSAWPSPGKPFVAFEAYLSQRDRAAPEWQLLYLNPAILAQIGSGPVSLRARVLAIFAQRLPPAAVSGRSRVAGLGLCDAGSIETLRLPMFRVACESTSTIHYSTRAVLRQPAKGLEWTQYLGGAMSHLQHPRNTWLSPLERRDAFFYITPDERASQHEVPVSAMAGAKLDLHAVQPDGARILEYQIPGLRLADFAVTPVP